jgi:hypothetical protein
MKYKAGDRVKIREDLELDKQYGSRAFTQYMAKWRGQVVTIFECVGNCYWLKDGDSWNWTDEMIEGLVLEDDDAVKHPSHYTDGKIEVIDFIRDKKLDFCRGNVVKYISRAGKKGDKAKEIEDLKKAMQYCQFAIDELEGQNGN